MSALLEHRKEITDLVSTWIEVGYPDKAPTRADVAHSALLERLIAGLEPFSYIPPRAYSYPWYQLCDQGQADNFEVHFGDQDEEPGPWVAIAQCRWRILETIEEGKRYRVGFGDEGLEAELIRRSSDDVAASLQHWTEQHSSDDAASDLAKQSLGTWSSWKLALTRIPGQ